MANALVAQSHNYFPFEQLPTEIFLLIHKFTFPSTNALFVCKSWYNVLSMEYRWVLERKLFKINDPYECITFALKESDSRSIDVLINIIKNFEIDKWNHSEFNNDWIQAVGLENFKAMYIKLLILFQSRTKLLASGSTHNDQLFEFPMDIFNLCCDHSHIKLINFLIDMGFNVNASDSIGDYPIIEAVTFGNIDTVKLLVENGANIHIKRSEAIMNTSWKGRLDIVQYLVAIGADINAIDFTGMTPIGLAVSNGHLEVVKFLLEKGADINVTDFNESPLSIIAAQHDQLETLQFLIESGLDVDSVDSFELTCSHYAAELGNLKMIHYLAQQGAKLDKQDENGQTPLIFASKYGHAEMVRFLITNGANINTCDSNNYSAICYASEIGNIETVKCLLEFGAVSYSNDGQKSYFIALKNQHQVISEMIFENIKNIK